MTPTPTSARRRTPAAARARLRRERPETVPVRPAPHGVRLARAAAWAAIAAGPCALALFLVVPRPSVAVAQPAPPVSNTVRPAAGPAGVAEVFTDLWLRGNQQNPEDSVGLALRTLAPTVELPRPGRSQAGAVRTVAVDTAPAKGGGWSVVVAALPESNEQGGPAVRYFAVPVAGESGRFVVTGAPGEVGAPAPGAVPQDVFRVPVPAGRPLEA
ncbi:hypothetical protein [Streptomyces sp. NPDC089799]|uniref:hypothetical protein n=1 Tax=Streptomyces sp. NPDC089799 TaxID=3155066 RepID=UPI00342E05A1